MIFITCTISFVLISVIFADTVGRVSDADEIFKTLDRLERRVMALESENEQLKTELGKQNLSSVGLKNHFDGKYTDLDRKQIRLKDEIKKLRYEDLTSVINTLTQQQNSLQFLSDTVYALNRTSKRGGTPPSFYALLTSTVPIRGANQIIVYDKTGTNNGNAYNTSTGIFTVPESGVYVFTWTAFSYVEEYVRLEIVVAGKIYGGTLSDTQETGDADTETGIIVANAKAGDEVFIRSQSRGPGDGRLYVEFECTSTFSGWKIS